ncbi:MAG TPA: ABC transporter substrate-binding protein [Anaerolineaceae bacterium]
MTKNLISRRQFLVLSLGTAAGTVLAACGSPTPAPTKAPEATKPPAAPTTAPTSKFNEAPMLAELVKAGKLPEVSKRLPAAPVVVKPTNAVGKYGGQMNGTAMSPDTTSDLQIGMVTGVVRLSDDLKTITPEAVESFEFSKDSKSCTIKMRKGMMWSDGSPFTADDMMFYFEDYQFNKDLSPTLATQWQPGGVPMKVTKVDDLTVRFDFEVPNPAFALVHWSGSPFEAWRCKKYMQKFHIKYNPDADKEAKAAGFDDWKARFAKVQIMHYGAMDPDMPTIAPWHTVKVDSQRQYYERNPYYFKVDTSNNQLPYIDKCVVEYVANLDLANLKAVSGEVTVSGLDLLLINNPVLKKGEQAGNYTVKMFYSERGADVALALNQLHKDPVLKQIFGDVRFRQALSLGIDRNEINELVFLGQGVPRQATINESASFFKKEWAEAYAKYDVEQANKLLDAVGLDKKGADGIRLRPDGKPMQFQLEYLPNEGPKKETIELVVKHWAKLGLKVDAQGRDRNFLLTRLNASDHDMSGWHVDRQLERAAWAYGSTQKLGPGGDSAITWAKPWRDWFISGGKSGQEPPQEAKDLFAAFGAWQQQPMGTPEYTAAGIKVYDLIAKNLWVIGVVGHSPQPTVVKNNLENVLPAGTNRKIWWGAANWFWLSTSPEQWFFKS